MVQLRKRSAIVSYKNNIIGVPGVIVKIDGSKFGKRKYHKGRRVDGVWVFGGKERDSKKWVFLTTVEDRTADTLVNIIKQHIKPGTILSDCWRAYSSLNPEGFY